MVIAAFDSTVVATTGITAGAAVVGTLIGYRIAANSARRQADAQVKAAKTQADAQVEAAQTQVEAQLKQLEDERAAADRQVREHVYLEFLNAVNGLLTLAYHSDRITKDRFYGWVEGYTKRYDAVLLLGVEGVSKCLPQFGPIQRDIYDRLQNTKGNFDEAVREACKESEKDRRKRLHKIVNAMRTDLAPDHAPIYTTKDL